MSEETLYTFENETYRKTYWHTCSHVLAQAMKRLHPEVKLAIGPSIDNGFYYDFDTPRPFTEAELSELEAEMRKICKEKLKLERFELPREDAIKFMEETNNSKIDLLTMMKDKGLGKQVKCIITENMDADGVHPLYLGLRYSKDVWKLKPYPIEKILHELGSGDNKVPAENDKKKPDGSDGHQTPAEGDKNKAVENNKKREGKKNVSADKK